MKTIKIFCAVLLAFVICSCGSDKSNSKSETAGGTQVQVTHPFITEISDSLEMNGTVIFLNKEIVRATFQGYIENVEKNVGDNISGGEVIFKIKTMESAAAESLKISFGGKQFKGVVDIKAKSPGVLTSINYHTGDYISSGEQLAVVSNPASIRIKLNVPYENSSKINIGSKCKVIIPGGETFPGTVSKNIPLVDSIAQTQTYYIKLIGNKSLPENLNVTVNIPFNQTNNALVLPQNAVITNVTQDSFWTMKLINDTTAVRSDF